MLNVFNIQRFSTHDGAGIRTNIFFKGCPLSCPWCSNPESLSVQATLMFDKQICMKFGECIKLSKGSLSFKNGYPEIRGNKDIDFKVLGSSCPVKALKVAGDMKSIEALISEIEKDLPFYRNSNGGVTLTGGEPLIQGPYLLDFLRELKKKSIDVSMETTLHVPWKIIKPYLDLIDCWLVDIKHIDSLKFKTFTGGVLKMVMKNLQFLDRSKVKIIARIPVIPDFNDDMAELQAIVDFVVTFDSISEIHFLPFHNYGKSKYTLMNMDYSYKNYSAIPEGALDEITDYAKKKSLKVKIGG